MANNGFCSNVVKVFMNMMILCVVLSILPADASAQKFKKHKTSYSPKISWWSVLYPNGKVGISVGKKKNIIVTDERGYSRVSFCSDYPRVDAFKVTKNGFEGVVDMSGKEIISPNQYPLVKYEECGSWRRDFGCYKVGNGSNRWWSEVSKVGIYDVKGNEILPCIYKNIELCKEDISIRKDFWYDHSSIFYIKAERNDSVTNDRWVSICDTTGKALFSSSDYNGVSLQFNANPTNNDLVSNIIGYCVYKDGKSGACDKYGKEIISPVYEGVYINNKQDRILYEIKQNGKWGVADSLGNILISPRYDNIYISKDSTDWAYVNGRFYYRYNSLFRVELNNKNGLCDVNGVEIIPPVMDGMIFWDEKGYYTYKGGKIASENKIRINLDDFVNPAQRITLKGEHWVLADKNGKEFSVRAYDILEWDEEEHKYIGSLHGYKTYIDQLGKEENSIAEQIFKEAYNIPDNNIYDKIAMYNMLMEVDCNNVEGYKGFALNNIGVLYSNNGDENTALSFFDRAAAMGDSQALSNASSIRKARKSAERAERWQRFADALGQINNALSSYSSTSQYNSGYSGGGGDYGQGGFSGGNSSARQTAYNHMAKRAAHLYNSLTNKKGYIGSSRTHSVELSTYNKLRRDMRNYRNKAQREGITIQKSQYEDMPLY